MQTKKKNVYKLTLCAVFIALASVLSLIKIYKLPLGGSVTLFSMLPIIMLALLLGVRWGLASSFLYSLIQLGFGITLDGLFGWGLTPWSLIGTIFLDYVIPFSLLGLVGFLKSEKPLNIVLATIAVMVIRFLCHFLSGVIIFDIWCEWESVWLYSLCYNGSFMLPELVFTSVSAGVIFSLPVIKRIKDKI